MAARSKSNAIQFTRVYDAPVALVWDAWTDPAKAAKWWGPRGFTITTHGKDLKPGGYWKYTMHGPDGTDYPNTAVYHEVEKHRKLVYDHGGSEDRPPLFRVTVLFSEAKRKTRMQMTMTLPTPEAAEEIEGFIRKANGYSTWDRLAEYLAEGEGKDRFVINRAFDAPIDVLFRMWTDPEHLARWLPPTGFTMKTLRADVRPGGENTYSMTNGRDVTFHGRIRYRELTPPSRIVYTQEFTDEQGRISRHPHVPTWPETMLTVVQLEEEEPGRTRVTVIWEPYGEASAAELEFFRGFRSSMNQGWAGSFDKLEALLSG
jgi:uncharacterized protein YndB with AHSA1/START domain